MVRIMWHLCAPAIMSGEKKMWQNCIISFFNVSRIQAVRKTFFCLSAEVLQWTAAGSFFLTHFVRLWRPWALPWRVWLHPITPPPRLPFQQASRTYSVHWRRLYAVLALPLILMRWPRKCDVDIAIPYYACPSHAGIVSKRLNISSKFFHCRIAPSFYTVSKMHQHWNGIAQNVRIDFNDIWQKYFKDSIE